MFISLTNNVTFFFQDFQICSFKLVNADISIAILHQPLSEVGFPSTTIHIFISVNNTCPFVFTHKKLHNCIFCTYNKISKQHVSQKLTIVQIPQALITCSSISTNSSEYKAILQHNVFCSQYFFLFFQKSLSFLFWLQGKLSIFKAQVLWRKKLRN